MSAIVIGSEADAWRLLHRCLAQPTNMAISDHLTFANWPTLHVVVRPGDGSGTPEIERAMMHLRKAVYRCYAIYRYGTPDPRRLTLQDRHQLAPEWRIESGSTKLLISLSRATAHFLRALPDGMSGAQRVVTVLGLGLMFSASAVLIYKLSYHADVEKEALRARGQTEIISFATTMTQEHTEQMRLLKVAYDRDTTSVLKFAATDVIPWRPALLDVAPIAGTLTVNSVTLDTKPARAISKAMKAQGKKQREQLARGKVPVIETGWIATVTAAEQIPPPMKLGMRA